MCCMYRECRPLFPHEDTADSFRADGEATIACLCCLCCISATMCPSVLHLLGTGYSPFVGLAASGLRAGATTVTATQPVLTQWYNHWEPDVGNVAF